MKKTFKNALVAAGLLSLMTLSAHAVEITGVSDQVKQNVPSGGVASYNATDVVINSGDFARNGIEWTTQNGIGLGGVLHQTGGTLNINGTKTGENYSVQFIDNFIKSDKQTYPGYPDYIDYPAGAVLYLSGVTQANIKGALFSGNYIQGLNNDVKTYGGAIFAMNTNLNIEDSKLDNNTASQGGALSIADSNVTINNSVISNNKVSSVDGNTKSAGGIFIQDYGSDKTSVTIGNTTFDGNQNAVLNDYAILNIKGGTSFVNNTSDGNGAAINSNSTVNLNTTDGNITFSGNNAANGGSDVYLSANNAIMNITGTNSANKVSFASNNSIAGSGNIIHNSSGAVEFINNNDWSKYTGTYIQENGKTSFENSSVFNNYNIKSGTLSLNNSVGVINKTTQTIGNAVSIEITNGSSVKLEGSASIGAQNKLTLDGSSTLTSNGGSIILNNNDIWAGLIETTTSNSSLTLNGFTNSSGLYNQSAGALNVNNGSTLTLDTNDSITGGSINVNSSNLTLDGNSINQKVDINVNNGANVTLENGSSIAGSANTTISNGGQLTVNSGSEISGSANTTINQGGTLVVDGTLDSDGKTSVLGDLSITENGNVSLNKDDIWTGSIDNNNGTLTLDGLSHNTDNGKYTQNGGNLILNQVDEFILGNGSSISGGNIDLNNSNFTVQNGGTVSGGTINIGTSSTGDNSIFTVGDGGKVTDGTINVGEGSDFVVQDGGAVTGGTIDFQDSSTTSSIFGTVEEAAKFDVKNNVVVDGGAITLNKDTSTGNLADEWTSDGSLTLQNGGTLNYNGVSNGKNESFYGKDGNLIINDEFYVEADSYIKEAINTTVTENGALHIGQKDNSVLSENVQLGQNTKWDGLISNEGGDLLLNNVAKGDGTNAIFNQIAGETTVIGNLNLNNNSDIISGGNFNIGTPSKNGSVTQTAGKIEADAEVRVETGSSLDVKGGSSILNQGDTWNGAVKVSGTGELTLDSISNKGTLSANGGTLNINSSDLTLGSGSNISQNTKVDFDANSSIQLNNGGMAAFDTDEWKGSITLNGGRLDYYGNSNGMLNALQGQLNTDKNSVLTITTNSTIKDNVIANIQGDLNISGTGDVSLGKGDTLLGNTTISDSGILNLGDNLVMSESGKQTITFNGNDATLNLNTNNNLDLRADIIGETGGQINKDGSGNVTFWGETGKYHGDLTVNNSGNLTFTDADGFGGNLIYGNIAGKDIGIIADKVIGSTTLNQLANITYSTYRDVDLVFGDAVNVELGSITAIAKDGQNVIFNEKVSVSNDGDVEAYGKNVYFENGAQLTDTEREGASIAVKADEKAVLNDVTANYGTIGTIANMTEFKNLDMTNSDLYIFKNGFSAESVSINGVNNYHLMNGVITDNNMGNVSMADGSTGNFSIDISARDWASDKFIVSGISTSGGTLNVSDFQFINKCPIDRHIALQVFDGSDFANIDFTATDKEIFTPIGWYGMFPKQGSAGVYTASLTKYNPQVFRGQVATVANFQNQLVVNNILFDHVQEVNLRYLAGENPNKYAAAYPQFAPYQYSQKDGGLWFKAFGTFEKLGMSQGLNVNNNFYGGLVGADFPAVNLKNGWSLLPTAYIAYTGAHQTFANMSMYQNGGQAGGMATFMKNDFIGSVLAYGGGYANMMDVAGYTDETGNWFAGTAAKAAYNFHPSEHFVIQPTLLASYNAFGQQRWHTDFGDMSMRANMLNGVNVAPGINFIYGRETWSIYATVQYFYNILGYSQGRAGNVDLPGVDMRHGFIEYGIGATKTWKDRFSGYLQVVLRNGGRTGIGFQGGLVFKF